MSQLKVQKIGEDVLFTVKVVPGSSRTAVSGLLDGMLKVKVSAPPQKGKANKCLISLLAKRLGVKNKNVRILSGETKEVKSVQILEISAETLKCKLGLNKSF